MKKNILYSLAATVGLVLASCSGDYDDWASPQSFTEGAATNPYNVSFTAGPDANIEMPTRTDDIRLVALTAGSEDVADFAPQLVTINDESIPASVDNGYIVVSAATLDSIIQKQNNSRASVARSFAVKTNVTAVLKNGEAFTTSVTGATAGTLKPAATPAIDAKGYYLLGNFAENGSGWDLSSPVWMEEVSEGVYEATVNTTGDGDNWYKFYEGSHQSNDNWDITNAGAMGCRINGDPSLTGFIIHQGDGAGKVQTPVIKGKGQYKVTLDMNNLVYTVKRSESTYYVIGNPQGWAPGNITCMLTALGDNKYSYTTRFTNQWSLKVFEGKYANAGDDIWKYCWGGVNGSTAATGSLIFANGDADAAGAIGPSETEGWYTFTIDMNTLTYTWTAIDAPTTEYTSVSLIGDFNSWGGDIDLDPLNNAPHNWYKRITIPTGGSLKFRANHDWSVSWGTTEANKGIPVGEVYSLDPGPENITVPAGTYDFYLNDITGRWSILAVGE